MQVSIGQGSKTSDVGTGEHGAGYPPSSSPAPPTSHSRPRGNAGLKTNQINTLPGEDRVSTGNGHRGDILVTWSTRSLFNASLQGHLALGIVLFKGTHSIYLAENKLIRGKEKPDSMLD